MVMVGVSLATKLGLAYFLSIRLLSFLSVIFEYFSFSRRTLGFEIYTMGFFCSWMFMLKLEVYW